MQKQFSIPKLVFALGIILTTLLGLNTAFAQSEQEIYYQQFVDKASQFSKQGNFAEARTNCWPRLVVIPDIVEATYIYTLSQINLQKIDNANAFLANGFAIDPKQSLHSTIVRLTF